MQRSSTYLVFMITHVALGFQLFDIEDLITIDRETVAVSVHRGRTASVGELSVVKLVRGTR